MSIILAFIHTNASMVFDIVVFVGVVRGVVVVAVAAAWPAFVVACVAFVGTGRLDWVAWLVDMGELVLPCLPLLHWVPAVGLKLY